MFLNDEQKQARNLIFHALTEFIPNFLIYMVELYRKKPVLVKV